MIYDRIGARLRPIWPFLSLKFLQLLLLPSARSATSISYIGKNRYSSSRYKMYLKVGFIHSVCFGVRTTSDHHHHFGDYFDVRVEVQIDTL